MKPRAISLLIFFAGLGLAVTSLAFGAKHFRASAFDSAAQGLQAQRQRPAPVALTDEERKAHARRGRLGVYQYARMLAALGDRMQKPGKERVTFTGTLLPAGEPRAIPFEAVYQQPYRLRVEWGRSGGRRVVVFDGDKAAGRGAAIDAASQSIIKTLLFDSAEGFFNGQMEGYAVRSLGARYRADDGTAENYAGPYYDIYEVITRDSLDGEPREVPKLFFFNSATQLLELVRYDEVAGGAKKSVEVRFEEWQQVGGQRLPKRMTRTENGVPVLALSIDASQLSRALEDGLFAQGR